MGPIFLFPPASLRSALSSLFFILLPLPPFLIWKKTTFIRAVKAITARYLYFTFAILAVFFTFLSFIIARHLFFCSDYDKVSVGGDNCFYPLKPSHTLYIYIGVGVGENLLSGCYHGYSPVSSSLCLPAAKPPLSPPNRYSRLLTNGWAYAIITADLIPQP